MSNLHQPTNQEEPSDDEWVTSDEEDLDEFEADSLNHGGDLAKKAKDRSLFSSSLGQLLRSRFGNVTSMGLIQRLFPNVDLDKGLNLSQMEIIHALLGQPMPQRKKLSTVNTIEDAVNLIKTSKKIIVLSGAGVSVSAGIPDFRSEDGIYARLRTDFPDLPTPQSMFEIDYFREDPRPFFKFAKEIYPGQFRPTVVHNFIKSVEEHKQLLRNYTQNIDTLEQVAGIERVINCHGSFATATCTKCRFKVDSETIKNDIMQGNLPLCTMCTADNHEMPPVFKPDIVFFGEGLPDTFHNAFSVDKDQCDLLIVIGSSMKVRPVALIPNSIPDTVPQILINREPLNHMDFDIELLGNCDDIIQELCLRLGEDWGKLCPPNTTKLQQINDISSLKATQSSTEKDTNSAAPCRSVESKIVHKSETEQPDQVNTDKNDQTANEISKSNMSVDSSETDDSDQYLDEDSDEGETMVSPPASLASKLPPSSFLYIEPSRYIFVGAEVNEREIARYTEAKARIKENQIAGVSNLGSTK